MSSIKAKCIKREKRKKINIICVISSSSHIVTSPKTAKMKDRERERERERQIKVKSEARFDTELLWNNGRKKFCDYWLILEALHEPTGSYKLTHTRNANQ
jgi:hypothetical protein